MDRIDRMKKKELSFLYPAHPVHPCLNPTLQSFRHEGYAKAKERPVRLKLDFADV